MGTHVQKRQLFRQRQLNHKGKRASDYGTQSHIVEPYSELIDKYVNGQGKKLFACFVDLQKAYETVPRI